MEKQQKIPLLWGAESIGASDNMTMKKALAHMTKMYGKNNFHYTGVEKHKSHGKLFNFLVKTKLSTEVYSFAEALADIAFLAGQNDFYSGDSRADISEFIRWAMEFEKINKGVAWGEDDYRDYIYEIEKFTNKKIKESKN